MYIIRCWGNQKRGRQNGITSRPEHRVRESLVFTSNRPDSGNSFLPLGYILLYRIGHIVFRIHFHHPLLYMHISYIIINRERERERERDTISYNNIIATLVYFVECFTAIYVYDNNNNTRIRLKTEIAQN